MLESMIHVSAENNTRHYMMLNFNLALRCVALASFKHEIVNLKKHVEEVEGENIQLKQTFTKIADEKKRLIKEADQSLDCVTKASEKKLE